MGTGTGSETRRRDKFAGRGALLVLHRHLVGPGPAAQLDGPRGRQHPLREVLRGLLTFKESDPRV